MSLFTKYRVALCCFQKSVATSDTPFSIVEAKHVALDFCNPKIKATNI